jgi:predicted HAD superfamily Cof-like phosphohydrolase
MAALREYHRVFGLPATEHPTLDVPSDVREIRCALIDEEGAEFRTAVEAGDVVGVADAIGDLLYVVYGAAVTFGIPADEIFDEVHRSNMTKLGEDGRPLVRADGKVLKGPDFRPPDLLPILARYARSEEEVENWKAAHGAVS